MSQIIGLDHKTDINTTQQIITMSHPYSLQGPTEAYVYIEAVNEDFIDSESRGLKLNALTVVDMGNTPYGAQVAFQPMDMDFNGQYFLELGGRDLTKLDVRLRDQDGLLLDLKEKNWQMEIKCQHSLNL